MTTGFQLGIHLLYLIIVSVSSSTPSPNAIEQGGSPCYSSSNEGGGCIEKSPDEAIENEENVNSRESSQPELANSIVDEDESRFHLVNNENKRGLPVSDLFRYFVLTYGDKEQLQHPPSSAQLRRQQSEYLDRIHPFSLTRSPGGSTFYDIPHRSIRRLGSEFLGKRSTDLSDDLDSEENSVSSEVKRAGLSKLFRNRFGPSIYASQKRLGSEFLGKRAMGSEFLGKRAMGSEFLGKRAMGSEFLGKRAMGSEFLGKRAMGSEFLGKRAMGSEFLGKRAMGSEFLGKRAMGSEFLGKRAMGSEFLGKRAMGSEFLGKRAMGSEFLGKRAMGSEFLGKRAMGSEFLGKRAMGSEFLGKRAMGSEFLGKRAMGSEFLGKRVSESDLSNSQLEDKRAMGSEFLGKRALGNEFLGKRNDDHESDLPKRALGNEFLGR